MPSTPSRMEWVGAIGTILKQSTPGRRPYWTSRPLTHLSQYGSFNVNSMGMGRGYAGADFRIIIGLVPGTVTTPYNSTGEWVATWNPPPHWPYVQPGRPACCGKVRPTDHCHRRLGGESAGTVTHPTFCGRTLAELKQHSSSSPG